MRQRLTRVLAIALVAGEMAAGGAGAAWAKTEFRVSNQLPPSHHISTGLVLFAGKVKEYSKGAVEVKIFDSAQLFKDTEIVEGLQEGLVESGLVPVNKWSGMIPAADVFEMPFIYKDLSSIKKFIEPASRVRIPPSPPCFAVPGDPGIRTRARRRPDREEKGDAREPGRQASCREGEGMDGPSLSGRIPPSPPSP